MYRGGGRFIEVFKRILEVMDQTWLRTTLCDCVVKVNAS